MRCHGKKHMKLFDKYEINRQLELSEYVVYNRSIENIIHVDIGEELCREAGKGRVC